MCVQVSWLGWSLYVGYLPHYGPRYMDVRFKGERIAYEISLQEALACEWTLLDGGGAQQQCGMTAGRQAWLVELFRWAGAAGRQAGIGRRSGCFTDCVACRCVADINLSKALEGLLLLMLLLLTAAAAARSLWC